MDSREREAIRQGIEHPFWEWLRGKLGEEMQAAINALCLPSGKTEPDDYLRGKIHAWNLVLQLPHQTLVEYDHWEAQTREDNPPGEEGLLERRVGPTPPEEKDAGRQDSGGWQP